MSAAIRLNREQCDGLYEVTRNPLGSVGDLVELLEVATRVGASLGRYRRRSQPAAARRSCRSRLHPASINSKRGTCARGGAAPTPRRTR